MKRKYLAKKTTKKKLVYSYYKALSKNLAEMNEERERFSCCPLPSLPGENI